MNPRRAADEDDEEQGEGLEEREKEEGQECAKSAGCVAQETEHCCPPTFGRPEAEQGWQLSACPRPAPESAHHSG